MRAMSLLLGFAIMIFVTIALTKLGKDSRELKTTTDKKSISAGVETNKRQTDNLDEKKVEN